MGLNAGDLEKVPVNMSVQECYERIISWHQLYGEEKLKERSLGDDAYGKVYNRLVRSLPLPDEASKDDMNFVFGEVVSMLMEWAYHEPDTYGIKTAAYAHFALDKQFANGFHDEEFRKSIETSRLFAEFGYPGWQEEDQEIPEEDFLGVGIFENQIRMVLLNRDGQYRFIDGTDKLHNILYVTTTSTLALKSAIEELEFLMNDPKVTEQAFQDFFERNPELILNDEYRRAHPHIALAREEGQLIPDFLLEPIDSNNLCDILDLKLPTAKLFVLKKSRMRYSAAVMEACAQLREYSEYFDDKENRDRIFHEYGLLTYKPKMIVIIGRKGSVDPIATRKIQSDLPQLVLRTYDDILQRAKTRIGQFK